MNDRGGRLIILGIPLLLLMLHLLSRGPHPREGAAALLRPEPGTVLVRTTRAGTDLGVSRVAEGSTAAAVIKLTAIPGAAPSLDAPAAARRVCSGDIVSCTSGDEKNVTVSVKTMNAKEKIALCIPLDPNCMDAADWEALPGIGPATARSILLQRQSYGDFSSFEELLGVPGIGWKTLKNISIYFSPVEKTNN